jgi:hypothetical protein
MTPAEVSAYRDDFITSPRFWDNTQLPIGSKAARKPRNRFGAFSIGDAAEYLPACARQPEGCHQPIASGQEQAVGA